VRRAIKNGRKTGDQPHRSIADTQGTKDPSSGSPGNGSFFPHQLTERQVNDFSIEFLMSFTDERCDPIKALEQGVRALKDNLRDPDKLRAFAHSTAKRKTTQFLRREGKIRGVDAVTISRNSADHSNGDEEILSRRHGANMRKIVEALHKIADGNDNVKYFAVALLSGMTHDQLAEAVSVSVGSMDGHTTRGKSAVRKLARHLMAECSGSAQCKKCRSSGLTVDELGALRQAFLEEREWLAQRSERVQPRMVRFVEGDVAEGDGERGVE
jgi:DNA-directed RNA polymerase specialized sigma24 family protein